MTLNFKVKNTTYDVDPVLVRFYVNFNVYGPVFRLLLYIFLSFVPFYLKIAYYVNKVSMELRKVIDI